MVPCASSKQRSGLAIFLAFPCYLCAEDAFCIAPGDIYRPRGQRVPTYDEYGASGLATWDEKTGRNQFATYTDKLIVPRLRALMPLQAWSNLFSCTSYHWLEDNYREAFPVLGLGSVRFTLHSLWHDSSTHDWLLRTPHQDTMHKARWDSDRSRRQRFNAATAIRIAVCISEHT